jgi:hypothetical protein
MAAAPAPAACIALLAIVAAPLTALLAAVAAPLTALLAAVAAEFTALPAIVAIDAGEFCEFAFCELPEQPPSANAAKTATANIAFIVFDPPYRLAYSP